MALTLLPQGMAKWNVVYILGSIMHISILAQLNKLEDNGGHYRFANIGWRKLAGNTVEFTLETAWRRDYGSTYWQGSGPDGLAITGDLRFSKMDHIDHKGLWRVLALSVLSDGHPRPLQGFDVFQVQRQRGSSRSDPVHVLENFSSWYDGRRNRTKRA